MVGFESGLGLELASVGFKVLMIWLLISVVIGLGLVLGMCLGLWSASEVGESELS